MTPQTLFAGAATASYTRWLPSRRALAIGTLFIVCYVLLGWATRSYLIRPFGITPWNPSAGLALALLLVFGVRFWPALAIGSCISSLLARGMPVPPFLQLLTPVSIAVGYVGMAAMLRGPLGFRNEFDRFRDIWALVAVAAVGTLLIAIAYVSVIRMDGLMPNSDFGPTVVRSWVGHLLGIVIDTPLWLILVHWQRTRNAVRHWSPLEVAVQFCAVALTLWMVFGPGWADPYKMFYLLFLPLIWIAMRQAIVGAILGINVIQMGLIMAVAPSASYGGIAVTEFQLMMLALAVTGLVLGSVVAEMREANTALDESESRLRAIVATAPDSIMTVDTRGAVVAANPATERIFGHAMQQLVGKPARELLPEFESVSRFGEATEITGVRNDGSRFAAELSIGAAQKEIPELRIAVTRDITRRKTMERQLGEKQAELNRAARLAAAGEMAAALAHELSQPLSAIRNYARAAQMLAPTPGTDELMHKVEHEAARAAEVVRHLRDFFRGGSSQLECIDVRRLIEGALAPMHDEARQHRVELAATIAQDGIALLVDRVQVETVIHSLVGNAIEAMTASNAGTRRIRVTADCALDGRVRCSVADTGPGISPAIADRLFEPFATTKPTGTGLGLAMSRSMIESHGGQLWAERSAGGGTVFHFSLPVADVTEATQ